MIILENVFHELVQQLPEHPPEVGGLLGSTENVIDYYWIDQGLENRKKICCYEPNVLTMNQIIEEWEKRKIEFQGIFHVHFWDNSNLSEGDLVYIKTIMKNMPDRIKQLYFPIITMPGKKLFVYVATREKVKKERCEFRRKCDG